MLRVAPGTVYHWEKGDTWPEADKIDEMARLFKIPVFELFRPPDVDGGQPVMDVDVVETVIERFGFQVPKLKRVRDD